MLNKPHFVFDDTDHNTYGHMLYKPFSKYIITPKFFKKNMGPNHIKFNSFFELSYLHPNYFNLSKSINYFNLNENYIIVRFIAWKLFTIKVNLEFQIK